MTPDHPQTPAPPARPSPTERRADKWFRTATGGKLVWQGVTYGPFRPDGVRGPWPAETQLQADFARIAQLGFNTIRIYEPPTDAVFQAATANGLRLLCGVPWRQQVDFFAEKSVRAEASGLITIEARRLAQHPCVCGLLVGNEIERTLVRWIGPVRVRNFLEKLISAAHRAAPALPVSYASYPPTEYLIPRNADFVAFNVFLEDEAKFAAYLAHLQIIADGRPLVITEFGLDSQRNGEAAQAEAFRWQRAAVADAAIAGNFWFSFTDEWHNDGEERADWNFGLVTRDRKPKQACASSSLNSSSSSVIGHPSFSASVIVCTRNGSGTLRECLAALGKQTRPPHEIILVDDGSTDDIGVIARGFPGVRYHRQDHSGLSVARNTGAGLASGEWVVFTDDDCIPDEDWLLHLANAFADKSCAAAGGPNLPPAPRTRVEAAVALAPGAPSEVLLGDVDAEHIPGCNLAIRKAALDAIGGFHPDFTTAGDDVDVCWRLQSAGWNLRFVPSAVVWHHRRSSIRAYLRQQRGYGRAEALLIKHHPERFGWRGGARWRGAIYGSPFPGDLSSKIIDYGRFGSALFPSVYENQVPRRGAWLAGLPWFVLTIAFGVGGIFSKTLLAFAGILLIASFIRAAFESAQRLPGSATRPGGSGHAAFLLATLTFLCWLQPIVRDWARLWGMLRRHVRPLAKRNREKGPFSQSFPSITGSQSWSFSNCGADDSGKFWGHLPEVCARLSIRLVPVDEPNSSWDFILNTRGAAVHVASVTEYLPRGARLVRVRISRPRWIWERLRLRDVHAAITETAARCGWLGDAAASSDSTLAPAESSANVAERTP